MVPAHPRRRPPGGVKPARRPPAASGFPGREGSNGGDPSPHCSRTIIVSTNHGCVLSFHLSRYKTAASGARRAGKEGRGGPRERVMPKTPTRPAVARLLCGKRERGCGWDGRMEMGCSPHPRSPLSVCVSVSFSLQEVFDTVRGSKQSAFAGVASSRFTWIGRVDHAECSLPYMHSVEMAAIK
ncbi:hypothetical protein Taro_050952 [Colocasia esculenta]|uniref:Uncharacterized protein n=1 Tax=Colocasia esculenta TaxID=4460 RepID=A0A843XEQ3_COLES|nr:hypothetical protein [Colocasia esculenta]